MKINKRARTIAGTALAAAALLVTAKTVSAIRAADAASVQAEQNFTFPSFDDAARERTETQATERCEQETGRTADEEPDNQGGYAYNSGNLGNGPDDDVMSCTDTGTAAGVDMYANYEKRAAQVKQETGNAAWSTTFMKKEFNL